IQSAGPTTTRQLVRHDASVRLRADRSDVAARPRLPRLPMLKDASLSAVVAGFIAVLVGFTSSIAIVFQAAPALRASAEQATSWVWALGVGTGITSIGLSWRYRQPVLTAWSTPGSALLAASHGVGLPEATGAFVVSAALITLAGATGLFERLMGRVP